MLDVKAALLTASILSFGVSTDAMVEIQGATDGFQAQGLETITADDPNVEMRDKLKYLADNNADSDAGFVFRHYQNLLETHVLKQ